MCVFIYVYLFILDGFKLDKRVENYMPTFSFPYSRSILKCFVLGCVPWLWRENATHSKLAAA